MRARVHRGERFTPPRLSDSETENRPSTSGTQNQPSPISSPSSNEYPDDYIPPTPGKFLEEQEETPDVEMSDDMQTEAQANPTSSNKRQGDVLDGGVGKKAKAGPSGSSNKRLPGTAKPQGLEGNGDRTVIYIDRPINPFNLVLTKFSKQHKFLTFGIANKILSQDVALPQPHKIYFLTTALAEIPVHKLPLYLNKSEFDLLPNGAEVVEIKITIVQRNALLSFQTNASNTSLATLNQNKNGVYAIGLNKTCYGCNRTYTKFNDVEKMIPETTAPPLYAKSTEPLYEGLLEDFYGVDNSDTAGFLTSLPKHQTGMYTTLKNYFCMTQTSKYTGGWPNLQSKIVEYDAAALVGEPILTYTYHPKIAPIKPVQSYYPTQLPLGDLNVMHGTLASSAEIYKRQFGTSVLGYNTEYTLVSRKATNPDLFNYYADIEKSQYMFKGPGGNVSPVMQPSLHIGINPVPALTTSAITTGLTNSNFTDTRSYFDVHCELIVGVKQYTDRPYADQYNVPYVEHYLFAGTVPNSDAVPLGTLYPNEKILEK